MKVEKDTHPSNTFLPSFLYNHEVVQGDITTMAGCIKSSPSFGIHGCQVFKDQGT